MEISVILNLNFQTNGIKERDHGVWNHSGILGLWGMEPLRDIRIMGYGTTQGY